MGISVKCRIPSYHLLVHKTTPTFSVDGLSSCQPVNASGSLSCMWMFLYLMQGTQNVLCTLSLLFMYLLIVILLKVIWRDAGENSFWWSC